MTYDFFKSQNGEKVTLHCSLIVLLGLVFFLLAIPVAYAQSDKGNTEVRQLINRAVLTAGREIYTAKDAGAMLMIWNLTKNENEKDVQFQTDWLQKFNTGDNTGIEPTLMMKKLSEDVRVFFQIALIWIDVQKLNLFVVRDQDIFLNLKKFSEQFSRLSEGMNPILAREILLSGEPAKKKWIDAVIRVRSFIRVRGDLERNKNLFSVGWYWHKIADGRMDTR